MMLFIPIHFMSVPFAPAWPINMQLVNDSTNENASDQKQGCHYAHYGDASDDSIGLLGVGTIDRTSRW